MSTNFYVNFIYFIMYSVIGWICEVIFCSIPEKKFINRGFLNGPLCPIYGFGALIVIFFLTPFKDSIFLVFIFGLIVTSTLEYFTSYAMEKLFHSKWWDYSNNRFNINGRVCLLNSILFGLMSVFVMFVLHIKIEDFVNSISYLWIQIIAILSLVILTVDITVTVQSAVNINEKLKKLRDLSTEIKEKLDEKQLFMEAKIHDRISMLKENIESIEYGKEFYTRIERLVKDFNQTAKSYKFFERRLIRAFPDMKSIKFQEQFQSLKNELEKIKNKGTKK